jgi:hypothetical protein
MRPVRLPLNQRPCKHVGVPAEQQRPNPDLLTRLVDVAIRGIGCDYPYKLSHVVMSDDEVRPPRELTPVFSCCFDWHSAVHSHWALVRLLDQYPEEPWRQSVETTLTESFTQEKIAGEVAFLTGHGRLGFEVPYGLAWLLQLCAETTGAKDPRLVRFGERLEPLEQIARQRLSRWLKGLSHPVRSGQHSQSAFAMALMFDWAVARGDDDLALLVRQRTRDFYWGDTNLPITYEPSGHDFLSPALAQADLLRRLLPPEEFITRLRLLLPLVELQPLSPVDRSDGKLVHFDGLNLSRAWMLRSIAESLEPTDSALIRRAEEHAAAGLAALKSDHYAGTHWLGSFAVYWLTGVGRPLRTSETS